MEYQIRNFSGCRFVSKSGWFCIIFLYLVVLTTGVKVIVLFAPCKEPVTNILHLARRAIGKHFVTEQTQPPRFHIKKSGANHVRHDLSDTCHWVSEGTIAVIAVTTGSVQWEAIDNSAHNYSLPHLVTDDPCPESCKGPPGQMHELAVFDYLKNEYLHDVIILHEGKGDNGSVLSVLLATHSVRMSHLEAKRGAAFLKNVERYFKMWNMGDLSDAGRYLVSLGGGPAADDLLKKLVTTSMHNMRAKILVVDSVHKWQARLLNVTAYEVDLVVVSVDSTNPTDCPTAIELMPTGSHGHRDSNECSVLSSKDEGLGNSILKEVERDLLKKQCCSTYEYTIWKSFPSDNGTQKLWPVAVWGNDTGLIRTEPVNLEVMTLRIAINKYSPYVELNVTDGELVLKDCVFKEILHFISERLSFKYQLLSADGDWGSKVNGVWTGAVGMILRGEADMIPYLTITPTRFEAVEFSSPLDTVRYGLLAAMPFETPRAFIFLRLYSKEVWILIIVSSVFISFVMYKMHVFSATFRSASGTQKHLASFFRCLWLIYGALLDQGGTHLPKATSGRLLMSTWWLAVMVITTTYSANLIAFLAFPDIRWVVKSLEELAAHRTLTLTIKSGCPVLEDFEQSNVEIYKRIRQVYLEDKRRFNLLGIETDRCCAVDSVAEGKTVYMDDLNYLRGLVEMDYVTHGKCRVTIPPDYFSTMALAIGMRRGSSLMHLLNAEIQQMKESGVLSHWKKKYSPHTGECYSLGNVSGGQRAVTLEDLQGPFFFLVLGLLFGGLFVTTEYAVPWWKKRLRRQRRRKRKKMYQRNISGKCRLIVYLRQKKLNFIFK